MCAQAMVSAPPHRSLIDRVELGAWTRWVVSRSSRSCRTGLCVQARGGMDFQVGGNPCVVVGVDEVAVKLDESLQSYQVGEQPGTSGLIGHLALQRRVLDVGGLPAGGLRHGA